MFFNRVATRLPNRLGQMKRPQQAEWFGSRTMLQSKRSGERLYSTVYSTHSPVKPSRTFTKCSLAGLSTCSVKNEPLEEGPSNRWDVCYMDRDAQGRQGMDRTAKAQIKQAQNGNTNQARGETSRWDVLHEQLLMSTAVSLYSGHLLHSRDRPV